MNPAAPVTRIVLLTGLVYTTSSGSPTVESTWTGFFAKRRPLTPFSTNVPRASNSWKVRTALDVPDTYEDAQPMTGEHLSALLEAASVEKSEDWNVLTGERTLTLHVAHAGVPLNIAKITRLKVQGELLFAQNARQEVTIVALSDVFAGAIEGESQVTRKAGFR